MYQTAEQELISDAHISDHKRQQLIPKAEILHVSNHETIKTKTVVNMLAALGADKKAIIVMGENNAKAVKSARNIPGVKTAPAITLNIFDVLNSDKIIVVKDAVAKLEEVYA